MALGLAGALVEALMEGPEGMDYAAMSYAAIDPANGKLIGSENTFQYWPETFSDTIDIGWSFKDIPGGSHALAQWASNNGRTFTFEVQFHRFMKPLAFPESRSVFDKILDPFDLNKPNSELIKDNRPYNVDIAREIRLLRKFCYPKYTKDNQGAAEVMMASPPPVMVLVAPNMALNENGEDYVYCVVTGCDVTYTLLFPNGVPRRATVALTLRQIVQRKYGVFFVGHEGTDSPMIQFSTRGSDDPRRENDIATGGARKGNKSQVGQAQGIWVTDSGKE